MELVKGCHSYTINERYYDFHFEDVSYKYNGSIFGLRGKYDCDYKQYDIWDKVICEGQVKDKEINISLTPIQFYRMAEQIFKFCNKEFGCDYPEHFAWEAYPNFSDVENDYDKPGFPEYIDYDFKLEFLETPSKKWCLSHDVFGGYTWGERPKSFYIALADGFAEFIMSGVRPNTHCGNCYVVGDLFIVK